MQGIVERETSQNHHGEVQWWWLQTIELMNLSSHYLDLNTMSKKVHGGGERHIDKTIILVVSLNIVLN